MTARRLAGGLAALAAVLAAALIVSLVHGADRSGALGPDPVTVSPAPGAVTASPGTQISFRGRRPERLGPIVVSGSESGSHPGELRAHADGEGASFVPEEPFEPGEEVTVTSDLAIPGAERGDLRFTVARPARPPGPKLDERPGGEVQRYRSQPGLAPPVVTVTTRSPARTPGYTFMAPKRGRGLDGPMIVDDRGKLVWAQQVPAGTQAADFRAQRYKGRPVLTWWEGGTNVGVGFGEGVVLDQSYREVLRVRAGNGHRADLHEFLLTPRGTALLVVYAYVKRDLTSVGGPADGVVIDSVVQEVDLRTGLVVFEWHSLDHIGLAESRWPVPKKPGAPYDYVHVNSVGVDADGDLLISGRHSWAVYKVDRATGAVRWRLGGRRSDFALDEDARFAFQHDARRRPDGAITLFDNAAGPPQTRKASRALAVELDMGAMKARVAEQREHPSRLLSDSQGSVQSLEAGRTFVGWGSQPAFSEFGPDGRLLLDGRLSKGNDNYRAYRGRWTGRPSTAPSVAAERAGPGSVRVFASWNGATGVDRWQVLAGPAPDALRPVATAERRGFETAVSVPAGARYFAARALGGSGHVLGRSQAVQLR